MTNTHQKTNSLNEFASFGAIHLNNTNLEKATLFWTEIVGLYPRKVSGSTAEFGTETQTLVVVHQAAKKRFVKGYSGLYHFAIHAPHKKAFASMLNRLVVHNYPFSSVDHTMSKSIYLDDPDGINIEFTLETPKRFKRMHTDGGLKIEDSEGVIRSASDYLDVGEVLKDLDLENTSNFISNNTYIGHLHLYANLVESSKAFYEKIGFIPFNYLPQFMYADLSAGGAYQHRIALNSWHGKNRSLAPSEHAGLNYFQIVFNTKENLNKALANVSKYEEKEEGFYVNDATGNSILLTHASEV
ncbi:VOC family protein [Ulvibacter litoralis]|uniref:Catechol 2,3-dioxygenase n=1 Tax=Ulvibacter litoralis TaxID=227084 RepID=A0A1G7ITS7_9FLAO|nr:VOC family protein [Ulvibacter litoralis]GHC63241.1 glyoxalase [Ulvibacter litoralis]SDF16008.1 catechol 2,3-dioxygenase [Ulvibacter litoralis]